MNLINEAKQMLTELESKGTFEKMVQVAAILTKLLEISKFVRSLLVAWQLKSIREVTTQQ